MEETEYEERNLFKKHLNKYLSTKKKMEFFQFMNNNFF